ncbi:hypothetical protein D3C85_1706490 [compost metagenome]
MQDVQQGKLLQVGWLTVDEQFWAGHGDVPFHHQQLTVAVAVRFEAETDMAIDLGEAVVTRLVGHAQADVRVALAEHP